ncbi:DNA-binding protein [bacterium]|nr:DNA-binding protein [bacterium]
MIYRDLQTGTLLRLAIGERIPDALIEFARRERWTAGWFQGIGGVEEVELAYFNRESKEYLHKKFKGAYELISCSGNLAMVDGEPFWHVHALIGDGDCRVLGGHLVSATIAVTGEFWLTRASGPVQRILDEQTGLKLLNLRSPETRV